MMKLENTMESHEYHSNLKITNLYLKTGCVGFGCRYALIALTGKCRNGK